MNKLVRDLVPSLYPDGKYSQVSGEELVLALREKLVEEAVEYLQTGAAEELCDVAEVMGTLGRLVDLEAVLRKQMEKHEAKGGFSKGFMLEIEKPAETLDLVAALTILRFAWGSVMISSAEHDHVWFAPTGPSTDEEEDLHKLTVAQVEALEEAGIYYSAGEGFYAYV